MEGLTFFLQYFSQAQGLEKYPWGTKS